jgi:hypothetical protein
MDDWLHDGGACAGSLFTERSVIVAMLLLWVQSVQFCPPLLQPPTCVNGYDWYFSCTVLMLMMQVILKQFSDPRCKGHIRLPAATCQFGMSEAQTSCVVVQISDDSAAGCAELARMLEVLTACYNELKTKREDLVIIQELPFPIPDADPSRITMKYERRIIIDLGGDLLTSGFAQDVSV